MLSYVDHEINKLTLALSKTTSTIKQAEIQQKINELKGVRR